MWGGCVLGGGGVCVSGGGGSVCVSVCGGGSVCVSVCGGGGVGVVCVSVGGGGGVVVCVFESGVVVACVVCGLKLVVTWECEFVVGWWVQRVYVVDMLYMYDSGRWGKRI